MNKKLLILILGFMSIAMVGASVTFAVIHVTTTVVVDEPISPLSANVEYTINSANHVPPKIIHQVVTVTNAASSNRTLNVTFTETFRSPWCSGGTYTLNMPMVINITSGETLIDTIFTCIANCPTYCSVKGTVNITRI